MICRICCFCGHRKIDITDELKQKLVVVIEKLIVKYNVLTFLFGSRSEFNYLCYLIVSQLKEKYPNIKRIAYTCKSETCVLESEKQKWEEICSHLTRQDIHLLVVDEEFDYETKYKSGKASYVERNKAMIDHSDYCVFYFDENYLPKMRKYSKQSVGYYQPKSGTKIAYNYAKQKRKIIINIKKEL